MNDPHALFWCLARRGMGENFRINDHFLVKFEVTLARPHSRHGGFS